jgi:hypothetical protein
MSTTNPKMSVKRLQVYSWAVLFTFADERYVWAPLSFDVVWCMQWYSHMKRYQQQKTRQR